ncbi:MAG: metallophosphatase family protein [Candidatus Omnitrophica bacterium]|nr:metallophosphatase family protein [Candidatus Omnitrophota bacterium]MCM8790875.1 metallophosphatase family protein [Candidatus Omnitrophota bacterium]
MRYGILSDIHSNLEAFDAVCAALTKERLDACLFIGDLVGYGADPHECIIKMKSLAPKVLIAGNHDWGVLGLLDMDYFNEYAASAVAWTARMLKPAEMDYLKSFVLFHEEGNFTLVHGSLNQPAKFNYILDDDDAFLNMRLSRTPLCFVGHSHYPAIFILESDGAIRVPAVKVKIEGNKKYVVNVGSVGQPRDGDPRASYVIYDDEDNTVEIRRIIYDVERAQEKILKAGLPAWLATRLAEGR